MTRPAWQLFPLAVALATPATAQQTPNLAPATIAALEARWQQAMQTFRVPGLSVTVVRGNDVIYRGTFGVRDLESKAPVTTKTAFYIASCTKPFVALAIMTLVEQGRVDLDAPVVRYLPRFALADPECSRTLSVRDLLCHRFGLTSRPIVFLDAFTGEISEDRYYHFLRQIKPQDHPSYSNVHFTLAGRVIEAVTGKPWRDYLAERLFAPAGLAQMTGYADAMYARADVALPTEPTADGLARCPHKSDRTMHAAGGLGASLEDLERWLRLHLNAGAIDGKQIAKPESIATMLQMQAKLPQPDGKIRVMEGFGLGWMVGNYRSKTPYRMHGGGYTGAAALYALLPEHNLGVAVLANSGPGGQAIVQLVSIDLQDRLLGVEGNDLLPRFAKTAEQEFRRLAEQKPRTNLAASWGAERARALTGTYGNEHWGSVRIAMVGEALRASFGELDADLVAGEGDGLCAIAGRDEYSGHCERDDAGRVVAVEFQLDEGDKVRYARQ